MTLGNLSVCICAFKCFIGLVADFATRWPHGPLEKIGANQDPNRTAT